MRVRSIAALLACAVVATAAPRAESAAPDDVYVRRKMGIAGTVAWLGAEARRIGASQAIVVFDLASFSPPPGRTEFTAHYGYFHDLDAWLAALDGWATPGAVPLRVTSSLAPTTVEAGTRGWRERARGIVLRRWWEDDAVGAIEPATRWMSRLAERTRPAATGVSETPPRLLALITGEVTPERWVPLDSVAPHESEWRTKLLPVGEYWDPEAVGALLSQEGMRFYAVAPEARFGDASPLVEAPDVPWASRPQFPWQPSLSPFQASTPRGGGEARPRDRPTDPTGGRGATPPPPMPRLPVAAPRGGRFASATPAGFSAFGDVRMWTDHTPSGYGAWPLVRTAARTQGKYAFYPFASAPWRDACPADPVLLSRLAPELVPLQRWLRLRSGDRALDAVCRAAALVVDDTPWADTLPSHRAASGWSALARAAPITLHDDAFLRRRPFDAPLHGTDGSSIGGLRRAGDRILERVLPRYDDAIGLLDEAVAAVDDGHGARSHPRSIAHLRLARFRFATAAFHLEAFALHAREVEALVPDAMRGHVDHVSMAYVPTIRMSDCLDAYDGRTLSTEAEARYARWMPSAAASGPGRYQGNLLRIPEDDPSYRARRSLASVLENLDPRLRRRALDMIQAGRAVMRDHARSAWGWATYYSDAMTFLFVPVEVERGSRPQAGESAPKPPKPTTPVGPGTGGGDSTAPSGPTTPTPR